MNAATEPAAAAPGLAARRGGWALSGLFVAFMVLDGGMKLVPLQPVVDTMAALGWPTDPALLRALGMVQLAATALYAWPRTAPLGAILVTAYLGGAIATHARIGSPAPTHTLFGVYCGLLCWIGLWLRDPRLRALLPVRSPTPGRTP